MGRKIVFVLLLVLAAAGCAEKNVKVNERLYAVQLCKHYNCKFHFPEIGTYLFGSDTDQKKVTALNDEISQVDVRRGTWRFYELVDYKGAHIDLGPGVHQLKNYNFNDMISSFKRLK